MDVNAEVAPSNDNTDVGAVENAVQEAPAEGAQVAPEDAQGAEVEQQQPEVPEKYTLPEGYEGVEQADIDYVSEAAKELGLDNDKAAALAKRIKTHDADREKAVYEAEQEEFTKQRNALRDSIGKDEYAKMIDGAKRVFKTITNQAFIDKINNGAGNDPVMIQAFSELYQRFMKEDSTNVGDVNTEPAKPKSTAEKIFG